MERTMEYPIEIGIAYLFLAGYLARTLFVSFRLPASVGVMISGFCFSFAFQSDLLHARDSLQELAFFLVLLTAGLEISLEDLKPHMFVLAWLPASLEMIGIAAYAVWAKGFTPVEGMVMGTILVAIGDGLVIPKMKEFDGKFKGHPLPKLMFVWAPLEASFVLTVFGVVVGLAKPASQPSIDMRLLTIANIFRIVATLAVGALIGTASGYFITHRQDAKLRSRPVFLGTPVEAFLLMLAVALAAFGLGCKHQGSALVPMGFSEDPLFQPELMVIVTGSSFAAAASPEVLHDVESVLGGVWVFGQLVLFTMLGSRTSPAVFSEALHILPMMSVGLASRLFGVFVACAATVEARQRSWDDLLLDALFCFLSTLPRATIQGALGSVPLQRRFFQGDPNKAVVEHFISCAARLYIVCMSVFGMVLLDLLGPYILQATRQGPDYGEVDGTPCSELEAGDGEDASPCENDKQCDPPQNGRAQSQKKASEPQADLLARLESMSGPACGAGACSAPPFMSEAPPARPLLHTISVIPRRLLSTEPPPDLSGERCTPRARRRPGHDRRRALALTQFEAPGGLLAWTL